MYKGTLGCGLIFFTTVVDAFVTKIIRNPFSIDSKSTHVATSLIVIVLDLRLLTVSICFVHGILNRLQEATPLLGPHGFYCCCRVCFRLTQRNPCRFMYGYVWCTLSTSYFHKIINSQMYKLTIPSISHMWMLAYERIRVSRFQPWHSFWNL